MGLFCLGNWAKVKWEESVRFLFRAHRAANRVSEGAWHGETHEKQGLNETWSLGCFSGMWRNSSNLLSYTALLRSLGTWFSHWLIVTKKILHTGVCWPFLSNHLKWDNPGGIHIVWNAKNRNCRFWRTYTLAHGINPRCRWWTADHQGGSDNNVIAIWNTRSQKKKKKILFDLHGADFQIRRQTSQFQQRQWQSSCWDHWDSKKSFQDLTWM